MRPLFMTILTLIFKEASRDPDEYGTSQISCSTSQHSQTEFPIPGFQFSLLLLLGKCLCDLRLVTGKLGHPGLVVKSRVAILLGLRILQNEARSLNLKAFNSVGS